MIQIHQKGYKIANHGLFNENGHQSIPYSNQTTFQSCATTLEIQHPPRYPSEQEITKSSVLVLLHTVGPMVLWMADYASQGNWFKIAQRGLINGTTQEGMWGQKIVGGENWDGTPELWTDTIPAALKPGNYLIRHEIIALHITNKPQCNLQCAHLTVTGSGTQSPEKAYLVKVPEMYSMDRGLFFILK
jgi:hypothetical protein